MPDATQKHTPPTPTFPLALRRARRWLLWRDDKVPYYAHDPGARIKRNGKLDSTRDTARLVDYKAALTAFNADPGYYSGFGFALGSGWYGLDFDHVRAPLSGLLGPKWVDDAVATGCSLGMYAEVSPSGTGVHLLGWWPHVSNFRSGRQNEHAEAYHSGRYFTMTGQVLAGSRLKPREPDAFEVDPRLLLTLLPRPTLRLVSPDPVPAVPERATRAPEGGRATTTWLADRQAILGALAVLSADCGHEAWLHVGMAIHHASKGSAEGLALWEQWSAKAAGCTNAAGEPRYVAGHTATRWASFERTHAGAAAPVTLGSLIHRAREAQAAQAFARAGQAPEQPAVVPELPRAKAPPRVLPGNLPDEFSDDELEVMVIPDTRWLVADLIAPGLTVLAAPPKAGKSYLALQMALCVAAGKPFLDRETTTSPVCYFDLEEWHALIRPRRTAIKKAHAMGGGLPLSYKLAMGVGDAAIIEMQAQIERGVKLIIVDLFARVRDELNENEKKGVYARDYAAITKLADFALQHPEVAIVVVHHANKGKHDEWQAKISGSYGLTGASHANVYLERPDLRGMDEADKEHAMRYRTLRAQGKLVQEQEIVIEMMAAGGGWQCAKIKPWEISATLLQTKVMLLLAPKYPAFTSAADIADLLGRPLAGVRKLLLRMGQRGTLESEGQGGAGYRVRR